MACRLSTFKICSKFYEGEGKKATLQPQVEQFPSTVRLSGAANRCYAVPPPPGEKKQISRIINIQAPTGG